MFCKCQKIPEPFLWRLQTACFVQSNEIILNIATNTQICSWTCHLTSRCTDFSAQPSETNLLAPFCPGFCRWWWTVRRSECRCCSWRLWSARGAWTPCPSRWPLTLSTWRASCAHSTTSCTWTAPCHCITAITSPSWSVNTLFLYMHNQDLELECFLLNLYSISSFCDI